LRGEVRRRRDLWPKNILLDNSVNEFGPDRDLPKTCIMELMCSHKYVYCNMCRLSMALRERQTRRKAGAQSHGPLPRGSRATERSPMEHLDNKSILDLELLATSLLVR
jgi:hypothetical protein